MKADRRKLFQGPWEFREAALIVILLNAAGFAIQFALGGSGITMPVWPMNAITLTILGGLILTTGLSYRNNRLVAWLGGIPLGLSLILTLAALSFIGGMVPQESGSNPTAIRLGLHSIFSSWPFALVVALFLINLGLSLSWKLVPFRLKNLQFILFHAGFWIALSCGIFGSSDLQRLVVPVEEGQANSRGYIMKSRTAQELPFSVYLHDFSIEEYPPQLMLYDPKNDRLVMNSSQAIPEVRTGATAEWKGIGVKVIEFIPSGLPGKDGIPVPVEPATGIPFAKVSISGAAGEGETWLSTGGPMLKPGAVDLDGLFLFMVPGSPKSFRSAVTLSDENGNETIADLEVNKPVNFKGWKIYQMGYDEQSGKFSTLSLLEVIRDPWLPAVYLGFFMMLAANTLFFWNGIKKSGASS
ncbi:cytochrome c biogenesis protein ResB [Chlorobium phaeovibrioides]|uniref:Cytochrome c biogenesis protein n=1 Tax=Chlorobium phaeovibrioides TaxID=1094 RepID=A0A5M8IFD7_CHLPH|nr:cytochrome c biogenesis protein ResB [Chlorobium phaeovibrioides]KAA6232994.1 cytochrome c biogenesis protein [Chlorobium phaeovibrioides]MWV53910.1 cytochrome c biogenesis protein [Chlorobium phaeovibrioides]QEQ56615.1 cytochrome c biogenesis protein [Chlorobium phaeovibrioides]